ncbi:MAG: hypothetical protein KF900_00905 [Bacteroidetes bacterium]|nr:hypothetical protein [Bacteroidota bacterium]
MAQAAGISVTKTANGSIKSVTFDYKKYGKELQPLLKKVGFTEEATDPYDPEFEKKWATGISMEDTFAAIHKHIKSLDWKKTKSH